MNIKNINKFKKKKLTLTLVGALTIGVVSPLVLTNASDKVVYGNTKYNNLINKNNINKIQNKYFEISKLIKDNQNLTVEKVDEILKNTNYISKQEKYGVFIVYKYENEEIVLSKNNISKVDVVTYNLYKPNKDLSKLSLSSQKIDGSKWTSSIQVFSSSIDKIKDLGIKLDSKIISSNLYNNYKSIINESENGKLDDEKLFNINPKLKNEVHQNAGVTYYQTNLDNYTLAVCSVNKTKDLESVSLAKLDESGDVLELLNTFNLSQAGDEVRKSYGMTNDIDKVHLLSISENDLDTLEGMLVKSLY